MPITVTCPGCRKSLAVPDAMAGMSARCKGCGATCQVPVATPLHVKPAEPWYYQTCEAAIRVGGAASLGANGLAILLYLPALGQPRGIFGDFLFMALCLHGTAIAMTVILCLSALVLLDVARQSRHRVA